MSAKTFNAHRKQLSKKEQNHLKKLAVYFNVSLKDAVKIADQVALNMRKAILEMPKERRPKNVFWIGKNRVI